MDDPSGGIHHSVDSHEWVLKHSALALDSLVNVIDVLQTLVQLPIQTNVLRHIVSRLHFILEPEGKLHAALETDQHWEEVDLAESGLRPLKRQIENLTMFAELCRDVEPSSCVAQIDAFVSSHKPEDDYFQGQVKIDNEHRTIRRMGTAYEHTTVEFSHQRTSDPWEFVVELFKADGSPVSFVPIFSNQNAGSLRKIAQTVRSTLKTIDIDVINEPNRTSTWKAVIRGCEQ